MLADFKLDSIFCEIQQNLNDLSLQQVAAIQGTLNALVYSAAVNDGLAYRSPDRALHFNFANLGYFFRTDRTVRTPVTFIADYLKKYWAGLAHYSRDAVQRIRRLISERFKVFTQEDRTADWRNLLRCCDCYYWTGNPGNMPTDFVCAVNAPRSLPAELDRVDDRKAYAFHDCADFACK